MTQPKIELRKISYNQRLSEETAAFAAQVWVDGVHVCDASNHGTGGPNLYVPAKGKNYSDVTALEVTIKNTFPKWKMGNNEYDTDLDILCGDLLNNHLFMKDLQRACNKKWLWEKPDGIYQVKKVLGREVEQLKAIKAKHGVTTLNEMGIEDALKIYCKHAA